MSKLYFHESLVKQAESIVRETRDLFDAATDMGKIQQAVNNIYGLNGKQNARLLDIELQQKYQIIGQMFAVANTIANILPNFAPSSSYEPLEVENLRQDYYGILCHVLLKKSVIKSIEQFIQKIE